MSWLERSPEVSKRWLETSRASPTSCSLRGSHQHWDGATILLGPVQKLHYTSVDPLVLQHPPHGQPKPPNPSFVQRKKQREEASSCVFGEGFLKQNTAKSGGEDKNQDNHPGEDVAELESRRRALNAGVQRGSLQKEKPARSPVKEINRNISGKKAFENY